LPERVLSLVSVSEKLGNGYRRVSGGSAFVLAALASFALAFVAGLLGAVAGMYLYDRANSKGDDFAVGLGGLFAVGTFTFVVFFTWLQKSHHPISSRTPFFALYACLFLAAAATLFFGDRDYSSFMLGDWLGILLFGLLSLLVCRRWYA
jgi:hypothetical protein